MPDAGVFEDLRMEESGSFGFTSGKGRGKGRWVVVEVKRGGRGEEGK